MHPAPGAWKLTEDPEGDRQSTAASDCRVGSADQQTTRMSQKNELLFRFHLHNPPQKSPSGPRNQKYVSEDLEKCLACSRGTFRAAACFLQVLVRWPMHISASSWLSVSVSYPLCERDAEFSNYICIFYTSPAVHFRTLPIKI